MGIEGRDVDLSLIEFWPPSEPKAGEIDISEHPDAENVATNNRMRVYAGYADSGENHFILIRTVSHDDYKRGASIDFELEPENETYAIVKRILDEAGIYKSKNFK